VIRVAALLSGCTGLILGVAIAANGVSDHLHCLSQFADPESRCLLGIVTIDRYSVWIHAVIGLAIVGPSVLLIRCGIRCGRRK
jgi:hypothetical protein